MNGDAVAVRRHLMEHLPPQQQVARARAVLEICRTHWPRIPQVDRVATLAAEPARWVEAHAAFGAVRELTLREERTPTNHVYEALLFVAEIAAKAIYNASKAPAQFDHNSPWWLPRNARDFVRALGDESVGHQLWRALTGS
jgi:hypothetical protein